MDTAPLPAKRAAPRRKATNGNGHASVLGAATRIKIDAGEEVKRTLALREDWQALAWDFYDAIGEVKFAINFLGDALSKLRLYSAIEPDEQVDNPPADTDERAVDALERLRGATGGHADLMREMAIHLSTPGQCYLVGLTEREPQFQPDGLTTPGRPERWFIASTDEVAAKDGERPTVKDPDGSGERIRLRGPSDVGVGEDPDFWARLWRRHPRDGAKADSSLRGVLGACEELLVVDRCMRSLARSHITFGSMVYVPDDISWGNTDPSTDNGESDDEFDHELMEAWTTPIQDEGSAAAVAPFLLRGPRREDGKSGIEVITIPRMVDATLQTRGEHCLRRIAQGLNLPVEFVFGLGQANHWGAGQIEIQAFRQHLEPLAILCVDALTTAYYREALVTAGMSPDEAARRFVWFDPVDLVIDEHQRSSATDLHNALVISDDALRRVNGFDDDDAPADEEYQRRAELKRPVRDPNAPPPASEQTQASGGITASLAGLALSRALVDIDRALKLQLATALDATVREAMGKVGNRLAGKARKDDRLAAAIEDVAPESVAVTLGPTIVATIEDPTATIELAVDRLRDRFLSWTAQAQAAALDLVPGLDPGERGVIEPKQETDRNEAWVWLRQATIDLLSRRIWDPHPETPADGEVNENMAVPFDIVREAVARAGGAARVESSTVRRASLFARLGIIADIFGIGTGPVVADALTAEGYTTEGYMWDYGTFPRTRPFPPHQALSGVTFVNFDDPVLASDGTFGFGYWTPGDHKGCTCDVIPVLLGPGE